MTPDAFRQLALSLPLAKPGEHFAQDDARIKGKIFVSRLNDPTGMATLKLTPEQQQMVVEAEPELFRAVPGAWGLKGWTSVCMARADEATALSALWMAWRNAAPAALRKLHPDPPGSADSGDAAD